MTLVRPFPKLLLFAYLVAGAAVAASDEYFRNVDTLREGVSAALAVALWPLLLLGIDLHVRP